MFLYFLISIICFCSIIPLYFLSVEHLKLQNRFGREKGIKLAKILGLISGWGFFLCLFGIWLSPQPRFKISLFNIALNLSPILNFSIPVIHLIISIPIISVGAWYGIVGVKEETLKVAETHRPEKVVTSGIYSKVRHPQYFGAILAHLGISFLLSAFYSLLSTPLVILIIYLLLWKEEKELLREFGKDYELYKKSVPMILPRIRTKK